MTKTAPIPDDLAMAIRLTRGGLSEQAIPLLDRFLESDPGNRRALRERGFAKSFSGDHAGAIDDFTAVIDRDPTRTDGLTDRGAARARAGDLPAAISDYSAVIVMNPRHPFAFLQRGRLRATSGDLAGAIVDFTADMECSDTGRLSGLLNRGGARHRLGDLVGAIDDLTEAIRLERGRPVFAPLFRGRVRLDMGDCHGAIADFTTAIAAFPGLSNAYRHRAEARALAGDGEGAANDLLCYERLGGPRTQRSRLSTPINSAAQDRGGRSEKQV